MRWTRASRNISSWIAIFAIVAGSLAPALSQALQASRGNGAIEVCTALGAKWISADDTQSGEPAPAPAQATEHCPYCSLQAHWVGLPPSAPAEGIAAPLLSFEVPARFLAAPRTPHAWVAARPRAPPQST